MKTQCPHCSQEYDIEPSMIGQKVQCEACGTDFFVEDKTAVAKPDKTLESSPKNEKMIFCYTCGKQISKYAEVCPQCGAPYKDSSTVRPAIQTVKIARPLFSVSNVAAFFLCAVLIAAAFVAYNGSAKMVTHQIHNALTAICILLVGVIVAVILKER